jgi:hypothetical protein
MGRTHWELERNMPTRNTIFDLNIAARALVHASKRRLFDLFAGTRQVIDLYLCIVDHFEPSHGGADNGDARERLEHWLREYPRIAGRHRDSQGRVPPHSFFYPWDEFDEGEFQDLADLCQEGWGEIELHLHHENDTEASLRALIRDAIAEYRKYGCLSEWPDGSAAFGFIHGNWALDNARCSGEKNFCGVNNELDVLQQEGCYADFTFPSWQHTSQPRQVNSMYYVIDDPNRPKSYDRGVPAGLGRRPEGLLLIQGPLAPYVESRFGRRRFGIDDGDLAASRERRYAPERLDRWVRTGIRVAGRSDRIFIKLHCHGAADGNREALLGEDLEALFTDAEARYNDGNRFRLHYVTAREMFNVVKATEEGITDSARALNWKIPPPPLARK